MNLKDKHAGHVIKREIINGKHFKHIIVKVAKDLTCDKCGMKPKTRSVQMKTTGNVTMRVYCMECAEEIYD